MSVDLIKNHPCYINSQDFPAYQVNELNDIFASVFHGIPWEKLLKKKGKNTSKQYSFIAKKNIAVTKVEHCFFRCVH